MALTIKLRFSYYKKYEMDIWGLIRTTLFFHPLNEKKRYKALSFYPWSRNKESISKENKKPTRYFFHKKDLVKKPFSLGKKRFFAVNKIARIWRKLRIIWLKDHVFSVFISKLENLLYFYKLLNFLKLCIFNFIHKELFFFLPINTLKVILFHFIKAWKSVRYFVNYRFKFISRSRNKAFLKVSEFFFKKDININSLYENSKLQNLFEFFFYLSKKYKERRYQKYQRYVYRIDIIDPKKRKKRRPYNYVALRLVRLYYLIYHYRQFNRLAKRIRKMEGLFEHNFCIALEGRLITALYRTGLVSHIFECIDIVNAGYFLINQSVIGHIHLTVRFGDLMGFAYEYKWLLYYRLLWRILRKAVILNPPKYLFVSHSLLLAYMLRLPFESDLIFPSSVDMFRATGYFR